MKEDIIQTINHYKGKVKRIAIYAISDKGRLKIQELNLEHGGSIRYKRLSELNRRGEGIYFAPIDDCCNMLFLDDPNSHEKLPLGTMVVQTSSRKYQLHIPFAGEPQPEKLRTEFQRQLCHLYKADKGTVYANHLRRLPGFYNQKYPDKPIVRIFNIIEDGEYLTLEKLTNIVEEAKNQENTAPPPSKVKNTSFANVKYSFAKVKYWADFYDGGESRHEADMRYVLYLLRMGASEEEIRNTLLQESEDISERKSKHRGHLEDYLDRTIRKAREYISSTM